jgi:hypothetical protein
VTVQFGKVAKGSSGNTDSFKEDGVFKTTVTLGPKQSAKDTTANLGETLVHEGVHGLDGIAAGGRNPSTKAEELTTERHASRTESYVAQGLRDFSTGLWSPMWSPGMLETYRNQAIEESARASTKIWCDNGGDCQ